MTIIFSYVDNDIVTEPNLVYIGNTTAKHSFIITSFITKRKEVGFFF